MTSINWHSINNISWDKFLSWLRRINCCPSWCQGIRTHKLTVISLMGYGEDIVIKQCVYLCMICICSSGLGCYIVSISLLGFLTRNKSPKRSSGFCPYFSQSGLCGLGFTKHTNKVNPIPRPQGSGSGTCSLHMVPVIVRTKKVQTSI